MLIVLKEIERCGLITAEGIIVENSSGKLGIVLAMLGTQRAYDVIIIVDKNTSSENKGIIKAHGAKIVMECELDDWGCITKQNW